MNKLVFLCQGLFIDVYFRNTCREAFEYKQHKATLKKMHKERTIFEKVLGLYSSSRTHAPHHMKLYKVVRVLNLLLCLLGIFLTYVSAVEPYIETIFLVLKTGLHRRLHSKLYYAWVNDRITQAYERGEGNLTLQREMELQVLNEFFPY